MATIGIGIVGGGYMGKAHAVAMSAVASIFDVALRPTLEMVCATTPETAEHYRAAYGFRAATTAWPDLVHDTSVDAVVPDEGYSMNLGRLKSAIRFEADKYIPFDVDEVEIDTQKLMDMPAVEGADPTPAGRLAPRRGLEA